MKKLLFRLAVRFAVWLSPRAGYRAIPDDELAGCNNPAGLLAKELADIDLAAMINANLMVIEGEDIDPISAGSVGIDMALPELTPEQERAATAGAIHSIGFYRFHALSKYEELLRMIYVHADAVVANIEIRQQMQEAVALGGNAIDYALTAKSQIDATKDPAQRQN